MTHPNRRAEPQRKLVTVLFADVSGFTAMSETMDAEDVGEVMNALWRRLDNVIESHNGAIDKHIGDAVMAVWGTAVTNEDDPERAIRAALAMQKELRHFADERQTAVPLRMRIGINTGPALLGEVGTTGEFTAMGDTVNTASRLESAAPVDGILISYDTYRHVQSLFTVTEQKPLTVKGKTEPLKVYTVDAVNPRSFHLQTRGIKGIQAPMIGRAAELEHLQDTFYATVQNNEAHVVTITGEAGIGKSRLLYEFDQWLAALPKQIESFRSRAGEEMQAEPYALLRDLFAHKFHIQDSDAIETVWQKLAEGFAFDPPENSNGREPTLLLGELLGFERPESVEPPDSTPAARLDQNLATQYLNEFFRDEMSRQAVIILLEDIQWADNSSLTAISHLLKSNADQPLMLICLARPSLFERQPEWGADLPGQSKLVLPPLTEAETEQLVKEILYKVDEVPATLVALVAENAQGNPYYVEELIKMLIEDGAIITSSSKWLVNPTRLSEVRIPPTLTGILQARLYRLDAQEQTILQRAAVAGRAFWDELIAYLGEPDLPLQDLQVSAETERTLAALQARQLITRQNATDFEGVNQFAFNNIVMREVIYENVLKRERRNYHARVAQWLIDRSGERKNEFANLIAEHLERAEQSTQAVVYLKRAGERAQRTNAFQEAIHFFQRALSLLAASNRQERIELTRQIGKAFYELGQWDAAKEQLQESLNLARAKADPQQMIAALQELAGLEEKQEKYAEARERLEESLNLARQYRNQISAAQAENLQNAMDSLTGAYASAQTTVSGGLARLRASDKKDKISGQLRALGRFGRKPEQEDEEEPPSE